MPSSRPELQSIGSASSNQDAIADDNFSKLVDTPLPLAYYPDVPSLPSASLYAACVANVWDSIDGNPAAQYISDGLSWNAVADPVTFPQSVIFAGEYPQGDDILDQNTLVEAGTTVYKDGAAQTNWGGVFPLVVPSAAKTTQINTTHYGEGSTASADAMMAEGKYEIDWEAGTVLGHLMYTIALAAPGAAVRNLYVMEVFNGIAGASIYGTKHAGGGVAFANNPYIFTSSGAGGYKAIFGLPLPFQRSMVLGRVFSRL